jgi:ubiquinone/menaquinone biosynthesis C-methylase UbiE
MKKDWNSHYRKNKSVLLYPDENLVRLVSGIMKNIPGRGIKAVDIGCGSGRHIALLENSGIGFICGTDCSMNALDICRNSGFHQMVNCDNRSLPFRDCTFDLAGAWGSLHYTSKDVMKQMLAEIKRIITGGGVLFSTLRRDNDTYLKTGTHLGGNTWSTGLNDLTGTTVSFFSEDELKDIFSIFSDYSYGWMERTIIGDTSKVISHWIISARK